jgi:hypothetical protein
MTAVLAQAHGEQRWHQATGALTRDVRRLPSPGARRAAGGLSRRRAARRPRGAARAPGAARP